MSNAALGCSSAVLVLYSEAGMRQVTAMRRCHEGVASFSFATAITEDRDKAETTIRDTVRFAIAMPVQSRMSCAKVLLGCGDGLHMVYVSDIGEETD